VFEAWKLGRRDRDNGVLLVIVPQDRKLRIEVGYGLEGTLTDVASSRIIRNLMTPPFKAGDYDRGVADGVTAVIAQLEGRPEVAAAAPAAALADTGDAASSFKVVTPDLPWPMRLLLGAFVFGIIGLFTFIGIMTPGVGWFLYVFLTPFPPLPAYYSSDPISGLFPGQAFGAPAGNGVAVVLVVERAFETLEHVVDLGKPGLLQRLAGADRALAAAADEQDRPVHARDLAHLADEVRIDLPVRTVVPSDVMRADRVADEQVLHLAAAVDEHRLRVLVQELVGFLGLQVFHAGNSSTANLPTICRLVRPI
jgi:hypothetical protein